MPSGGLSKPNMIAPDVGWMASSASLLAVCCAFVFHFSRAVLFPYFSSCFVPSRVFFFSYPPWCFSFLSSFPPFSCKESGVLAVHIFLPACSLGLALHGQNHLAVYLQCVLSDHSSSSARLSRRHRHGH